MITLSREEMKNPFNRLLLALVCFDSIFIGFVVLDYSFIRGIVFLTLIMRLTWSNGITTVYVDILLAFKDLLQII